MKTNSYKDLLIWQRGIDLVESVYEITAQLPPQEKYGLATQLQRAAVSVPSNIAEGYKRNNLQEYIQFCGIASGSIAELDTQLIIVAKVYPAVTLGNIFKEADTLQAMLYSFIKQLKNKRAGTVRRTLNAVR
ncbi:four helix bundle protein [Candidatus Saccharibacteria bacterium]|nr:four helix bundle protein [Candidatus Saccharibacteria bacterium]